MSVRRERPMWHNLLFLCICLPCIPICCSIIGVEAIEKKRKKEAAIPKPLPRRRRALSVSHGDASIKNMGLFGRLPYELRHLIYLYTLGNQNIHLFRIPEERKIASLRCHVIEHMDRCHQKLPSYGKLPLLGTCRQIYIEASEVLYTTNVFDVYGAENLATFVYFSRTIPPARLASISSLKIDCKADNFRPIRFDYRPTLRSLSKHIFRAPEDQRMWVLLWGVIAAKMPGLKDLHVCLTRTRSWDLKLDLNEEWLEPMLDVRGLRTFKFHLWGRHEEYTDEYGNRLKWLQRYLEDKLCSPS